MTSPAQTPAPSFSPSEDAIREYAYQLYVQGNRIDGHDVENWREATACLRANIPAHLASTRVDWYLNRTGCEQLSLLAVEARVLSA